MSAGEVLEEELVYYLNPVALVCVVTGERENEEEESDLSLRRHRLRLMRGWLCSYGTLAWRIFSVFTREGGMCVSICCLCLGGNEEEESDLSLRRHRLR